MAREVRLLPLRAHLPGSLAALTEFGATGAGSLTRWMFFSLLFQDGKLVSTEPPDQYQLIGLQMLALGDTAHRDRAWR